MKLTSTDGSTVELSVVGYQFPDNAGDGSGADWDANWLVIRGDVQHGHLRSTFEDPCLTTTEARELDEWLRAAASGDMVAAPYEDDNDVRLKVFTEPNIALNLAERTGDEVTVRVYLSLEAQPTWARDRDQIFDYYVPIRCSTSALRAAADAWESDLNDFPIR